MLGELAVGVGSSIIGALANGSQKKADKKAAMREKRAFNNATQPYREGTSGAISNLNEYGEEIEDESRMGADERFGDSLNVMRDRMSEEGGATRRSLIRGAMASGDLIGSGGVIANQITENQNEAVGTQEANFAVTNENINQDLKGLRAGMIRDEIAGNKSMLDFEGNQANTYADRKAKRTTARRQNTSSIIGGAANIGLNFLDSKGK